jgi:uncharacterized protein (TIRG00374 family)
MNAEAPAAAARAPMPLYWRGAILTVVLAVAGYGAMVVLAGARDIGDALGRIGWQGACILLALSLLNYLLRFARWQLYLRRLGVPQPWAPSLLIYFAGFALTTTPGKAGEMLRSWFLGLRGVGYRESIAAFFSERLSDLTAVTLLALLGVRAYPAMAPFVLGMLALVVLLHVLAGSERWLAWAASKLPRWPRMQAAKTQVELLAGHARACHAPSVVAFATALSFLAWAAEAWGLHLVLLWLDGSSSPAWSMFTYAASMLVGAVSFLPGGLGGTEIVMVGLLLWAGHTRAVAAAATLVVRAATLWFAVMLGLVALAIAATRPAAVSAAGPAR